MAWRLLADQIYPKVALLNINLGISVEVTLLAKQLKGSAYWLRSQNLMFANRVLRDVKKKIPKSGLRFLNANKLVLKDGK